MSHLAAFGRRWWAVFALLLAWQLLVTLADISPFLLPGPVAIVERIAEVPAEFGVPLLLTIRTAFIGFVLGVSSGFVVASVAWIWPALAGFLTPVALIIRTVPFVALIPVLARLLGYTDTSAWIICAMVTFFPSYVLVSSGLRDVPTNSSDLFSVAGAARLDHYRLLAVPHALPGLATAIRICAASSIAAALIAEFLMGIDGLAGVLADALAKLDMTQLWGAAACAIVASIAAYLLANGLERSIVARWT